MNRACYLKTGGISSSLPNPYKARQTLDLVGWLYWGLTPI